MPWVSRDNDGHIDAVHFNGPNIDEGITEVVAEDSEELLSFLNPVDSPKIPIISDRQFFQMLAMTGTITQQEALDAVKTGSIPGAIQTMVDAIEDDDERFVAQMLLSGATTFRRDHPITSQIGAAQGMTEQQIDEFFVAASQL